MPKALTITRADCTAAALREAARRSNDADARGGCWRWPWFSKAISGRSRQALRHGSADLARLGSPLPRRRRRRALKPHNTGTETAPRPRAGGGGSRAGSQRTRPCRGWRPRDQDAFQCDIGRAQRRRDVAPARVPALVGAAAPSAAGPGGAGGAQKNFADLVAAAIPEHAREQPIELWWQDEARVGQQH